MFVVLLIGPENHQELKAFTDGPRAKAWAVSDEALATFDGELERVELHSVPETDIAAIAIEAVKNRKSHPISVNRSPLANKHRAAREHEQYRLVRSVIRDFFGPEPHYRKKKD